VTDDDAPPVDDPAAAMVRSLERPDRWLWVACAGPDIVGFARLSGLEVAETRAETQAAPTGLYLGGVSVSPVRRRLGIGTSLTRIRLSHAFQEQSAEQVWYFANARNEASIALHAALGFVEVERPMRFAPVSFAGGVGVLFVLSRATWAAEAGAR
jgi:RimJ/RimL family protein N-acetyltransferase